MSCSGNDVLVCFIFLSPRIAVQAGVPFQTAEIAELEAAVALHSVAASALLNDGLAVRAGLILVVSYSLHELLSAFLFFFFFVSCSVFLTGLPFMIRDLAVETPYLLAMVTLKTRLRLVDSVKVVVTVSIGAVSETSVCRSSEPLLK